MEERALIQIPRQLPVPIIEIDGQALLDSFLSGKSGKTILPYKKDLQDFQRFIEAETERKAALRFISGSLGQANSLALQYRQHLINRGLQPTTINRKLAALRSLSDMAYTLGMVNWRVRIKNQKVFDSSRDTQGPGKTGVQKLREEVSRRTDAKGLRD